MTLARRCVLGDLCPDCLGIHVEESPDGVGADSWIKAREGCALFAERAEALVCGILKSFTEEWTRSLGNVQGPDDGW